MNHVAVQSLNWRTPLEVLEGITPDISAIYQMPYRTKVYFQRYEASYPSESEEDVGYFVGFSANVGHKLTFKVLTIDTRKILYRSCVQRASDLPNQRIDPTPSADSPTVETVDPDQEDQDDVPFTTDANDDPDLPI